MKASTFNEIKIVIANATIKVDWIVKLMEQTNKAPFKSTLTVIDDDVWTSYIMTWIESGR